MTKQRTGRKFQSKVQNSNHGVGRAQTQKFKRITLFADYSAKTLTDNFIQYDDQQCFTYYGKPQPLFLTLGPSTTTLPFSVLCRRQPIPISNTEVF